MNYILRDRKTEVLKKDDFDRLIHNLDLYYMYEEYVNECNKLSKKVVELNNKLENNENELIAYNDNRNRLLLENQFIELYRSLNKDLKKSMKTKEELERVVDKFHTIDNCKDRNQREQLISELNTEQSYIKYKNDIMKAYEYNNIYIENVNKKIEELKDNFNVDEEDNIKSNKEVVGEFKKKIHSLDGKVDRAKDSIENNKDKIQGLIDELNKFLQLNNYEDVNVYTEYLQNLNFVIKTY